MLIIVVYVRRATGTHTPINHTRNGINTGGQYGGHFVYIFLDQSCWDALFDVADSSHQMIALYMLYYKMYIFTLQKETQKGGEYIYA